MNIASADENEAPNILPEDISKGPLPSILKAGTSYGALRTDKQSHLISGLRPESLGAHLSFIGECAVSEALQAQRQNLGQEIKTFTETEAKVRNELRDFADEQTARIERLLRTRTNTLLKKTRRLATTTKSKMKALERTSHENASLLKNVEDLKEKLNKSTAAIRDLRSRNRSLEKDKAVLKKKLKVAGWKIKKAEEEAQAAAANVKASEEAASEAKKQHQPQLSSSKSLWLKQRNNVIGLILALLDANNSEELQLNPPVLAGLAVLLQLTPPQDVRTLRRVLEFACGCVEAGAAAAHTASIVQCIMGSRPFQKTSTATGSLYSTCSITLQTLWPRQSCFDAAIM